MYTVYIYTHNYVLKYVLWFNKFQYYAEYLNGHTHILYI